MRKIVVALCVAVVVMLAGCAQTGSQESGAQSESSASASAQESSQVSGEQGSAASDSAESASSDSDEAASEMPEFDFGMDESAYLVETYGAKETDCLDLINMDQLTWLSREKVRAAIVVVDASDESSAAMVAAAQKAAKDTKHVAYVYEPARDAADGAWDSLVPSLVQGGLVNLETLKPGMILTLSKLTVDSDGNPAPVTDVCTDSDGAYDAVLDAYSLACCR